MTECNGCGRCCSPVVLPYRVAALGPDIYKIEPENRDWVLTHLTEITPRRAGLELVADYMPSGRTSGLMAGQEFHQVSFFYSCDWYDPDTRQCTAHDRRPPICSGYPWYDQAPDSTKAIPSQCEFNLDVGKAVVPL